MTIELKDVGKRFNYEWIFRHVSTTFTAGNAYALIGSNGSGKSTLMRVIAGQLSPSEGQVAYRLDNNRLNPEDYYKHLSIAAPYVDLINDLSLVEMIRFHQNFKSIIEGIELEEVLQILGLTRHKDKPIKHFSSGMKQRTRLLLALLSEVKIVFLDEPCSNLDKQGIAWYQDMIAKYTNDKIIIVASNQPYEYEFCSKQLKMSDYKQFKSLQPQKELCS